MESKRKKPDNPKKQISFKQLRNIWKTCNDCEWRGMAKYFCLLAEIDRDLCPVWHRLKRV